MSINHSQNFAVTVKAVIIYRGQILFLKDRHGMLDLPGGRLQSGETIRHGLVRELKEELGLSKDVYEMEPQPAFVWEWFYPEKNYELVGMAFLVKVNDLNIQSQEGEDIIWVNKHDLSLVRIPAAHRTTYLKEIPRIF